MGTSTEAVLDRRYRLNRRIGRGGMADVWAADDLVLHRLVAVKVFRFDTPGTDPERIDAEMRTIAQLSHPGVVNLYDAGAAVDPTDADGARVPYLVMELVRGQTLEDRLADGSLSPAEARELGGQLADTFGYLHARGVVHRDVKPANILLQPLEGAESAAAFRARLTDFGIARLADTARITEIGMTIGTANYLSPEQATGGDVGPPSDIYSLGLVLLESRTGQVAYPGTGVAAATARLYRPPEIPDALGPRWCTLLTAMTAWEPGDRPSATDVSAELAHPLDVGPAAEDPTAVLRPDEPAPTRPTEVISGWTSVHTSGTRVLPASTGAPAARRGPRARSSTPLVWAALIAALLVVVLVVVLVSGGDTPTPAPNPTDAPSYPAVSGQVGKHLHQLEDTIG
ncbi:MAG TPA: protein kinase [Micromonosporaceae bacterium]